MTSRVPFTAITAESLARLDPAERLAFRAAAEQIARGENPRINTTAALLLTIQRLIAESPQIDSEEPAPGDSGQAPPASVVDAGARPGAVPALPLGAAFDREADPVARLRQIADHDIGGNAPWLAGKLHAFADQLAAEMRGECQLEAVGRAEAAEAEIARLRERCDGRDRLISALIAEHPVELGRFAKLLRDAAKIGTEGESDD